MKARQTRTLLERLKELLCKIIEQSISEKDTLSPYELRSLAEAILISASIEGGLKEKSAGAKVKKEESANGGVIVLPDIDAPQNDE